MFSTLKNSLLPVWSPDDEGAGGDAAASSDAKTDATVEAKPDAAATMYPDDKAKPAAGADDADLTADDVDKDGEGDKSEDDKPAELSDEEKEAKLDLVPEDGKYELVMPDGVEVDAELLAAVGPEFAEMGLSTRDAQKITDKFIATMQERETARASTWANTVSGWADEAKKDAEIGGDKWDGTVAAASGVVQRFGNEKLAEYLNASGAGNHPEMIRFMAKVGAMIGEDNPAISENPRGGQKRDTAAVLYPNDTPKGK